MIGSYWNWRLMMDTLNTDMSICLQHTTVSNGMLQIQYSAVPRSWLNCTSYGVGGTSVVGWLWSQFLGQLCATLPALAVQGCHGSWLNPVFHSNSPWVRGFWEAFWSALQSQKLLLPEDWQEIGLLTYTFPSSQLELYVPHSFHSVSCTMGNFFIGMIWLRGPASWNGLLDSYS